jgi:hypothetical protein
MCTNTAIWRTSIASVCRSDGASRLRRCGQVPHASPWPVPAGLAPASPSARWGDMPRFVANGHGRDESRRTQRADGRTLRVMLVWSGRAGREPPQGRIRNGWTPTVHLPVLQGTTDSPTPRAGITPVRARLPFWREHRIQPRVGPIRGGPLVGFQCAGSAPAPEAMQEDGREC